MKAAILIPVLVGKDAVGADAMAMARVLEAKGIDTRIFCESAENAPMPTWPAPPPAIEAAKTSANCAEAPLKPTVAALETLLLTASRPFAAAFSPLKPC